jgi:hypothetical protein
MAGCEDHLGYLTMLDGDYTVATAYLQESLELARSLSLREHVILAMGNLALTHLFNAGRPGQVRLLAEPLAPCVGGVGDLDRVRPFRIGDVDVAVEDVREGARRRRPRPGFDACPRA